MHFGVLDEFSVRNVLFDLFHRREIVVDTVLFARTWRARGVRNREAKLIVGEALLQHFNQSAFPDA